MLSFLFYTQKSTKTTKTTYRRTSDFFPLRCFFQAHLKLFFLFYTHKSTKAQKAHKKHKNAKKRIGDFFPLRCFFVRAFKTVFFVGFNKLVKVGMYGLTFTNLPIPKWCYSPKTFALISFRLKNKTALIPSFILLLSSLLPL